MPARGPTAEAPLKPDPRPSSHDGHEDYLSSLEPDFEDARFEASLSARLLRKVEIAVAIGVGLSLGYQLMRWIGSAVRGEMGFGGVAFLLVALVVAVIGGGVFAAVAAAQGARLKRRALVLAGGVACILLLFVLPMQRSAVQQHQEALEREERGREAQQELDARTTEWREALRADGRHGPPGTVPPMLRVEDDGERVQVTNAMSSALTVALARVREDGAAPGGVSACAMRTRGRHGGNYYWYALAAGETAVFEPLTPACAERFRGAPVEYRVGRAPGEQGWWSDSAFAAPAGRENEGYEVRAP